MLDRALTRGFHEGRLRLLLSLFFLALAIPMGLLIWQAYSQLKWEAFHQYRGMAEELSRRIDANLVGSVGMSEARSFADYGFLVVSGDPSANFLQQSSLSTFPVPRDLPGLLGYFQVGSEGEFSTPLLPTGSKSPEFYGISKNELEQRRSLADKLRAVLSDNRLVEYRPSEFGIDSQGAADAPYDSVAGIKQEEVPGVVASPLSPGVNMPSMSDTDATLERSTPGKANKVGFSAESEAEFTKRQALDSQLAFDELNEARSGAYGDTAESGAYDDALAQGKDKAKDKGVRERNNALPRVTDLKLDEAYQKKSADLELAQRQQQKVSSRPESPARITRKEKISVAESVAQMAGERDDDSAGESELRISTFESEIDPLEFNLLDSGHFVLFRKVWREGERYIQGMLIEQRGFIEDAIDRRFQETALSAMSDLIVAYQGDVLVTSTGRGYSDYTRGAGELDGALLYRNRLSTPFDSLELIYTVNRLPPGPGAQVLGWVSLVLGLVLCSGVYALYRIGISQISLARQQQDFVSAVSHELKTPLTSIRMYGEMLKEGWAADEKKQGYYEFIHDESERLTRLISNVLQLANITRNKPQLEIKPVAVGEVMASIESKIATQVQRADFELVFWRDPEAEMATIDIDQDCFAQIIINLVDNAIKFSRGAVQKRIEIGCSLTSDNKVLFSVRDFGPGIPKDQMRKIFDMFYRSESELTRETVGTGIGLAIVRQLSVVMNAGVDVMNRDPGAEFRVSVPVSTRGQ